MATASTRDLIRKIAAGNYSDEDLAIFLEAVREMDKASFHEAYQLLYEEIGQYSPDELAPNFKDALEMRLDALERSKGFLSGNLAEGQDLGEVVVRRRWWRYAAAAVILFVLIGGGFFLYYPQKGNAVADRVIAPARDVLPGGNKAVLTLAGGQRIILDSAVNGVLSQQGNAKVQKLDGGQLAYQRIEGKPTEAQYNTLTTPRGGQYQLTLADGTKVWLNAASSITYPTVFVEKERVVKITGEAYFEVIKNADKPFRVIANGKAVIDVLGTDFNINAYDDENSIITTLLEGSVKVEPGVGVDAGRDKPSVVLKPGQQAKMRGESITLIPGADVDQVVAWKNGLFSFSDADLPSVMRQLARWYDVDVSYEGNIPKRAFNGTITRSLTLNQLLIGLARSRVHYTIDSGNKLVIRP